MRMYVYVLHSYSMHLTPWPLLATLRRPPRTFDPRLFSQMKVSQSVGFVPRPPNMKHNQVPYDLVGEDEPESPMMRGSV